MSKPSAATLSVGTIISCFIPRYSDEEPQLGKVIDIGDGENVEVEWMVGSYSEPWRIWKEKEGKEYVSWKDVIPKDAILFPVALSKTDRLLNSDITKLKAAYREKRVT